MTHAVILYADDGLALGEHLNVFISVLHAPSTMPRLREVRRHLARLQAKRPHATCGITVVGAQAFVLDLPKEVREESAAITRDFPSAGNTIVVESTGFVASVVRAFLSGIWMMTKRSGKVHSTVAEGAAWLAPVASAVAKTQIRATDLVRAVEETRAAIGQP
jgi:hypothetical protein